MAVNMWRLLFAAVCLGLCSGIDVSVSEVTGYTKLKSCKSSSLYRVEADTDYAVNPMLIHLTGSRFDIGYGYGCMLSEEIEQAYTALLNSMFGDKWYDAIVDELLGKALDWQWDKYLSRELPLHYVSELEGVSAGSAAQGCSMCGRYVTRIITLANAPGDLEDWLLILEREVNASAIFKHKNRKSAGMQCSMFAVWGDRTESGQLFSARNLDWNKDTGINKNKLVMVVVPNDGGNPSASLGFAGLFGTLAGMSSKGLTVHEANLEEDRITFDGFPWSIRLRYIMEFANNIVEARQLWASSNNTVGFNHMVASAPDAEAYLLGIKATTVALALETMYQYTAYFADNDPREAAAMYVDPKNSSSGAVHIGFPLRGAVWRTNHGYDPVIRDHFEWSQSPNSWSMQRYMFMHDSFTQYQQCNTKIGVKEALNITAIVGDKGKHAFTCMENTDGSNVLSVTFQPQQATLYAAWERSMGANWRPATCSSYIKFPLTDWFKSEL